MNHKTRREKEEKLQAINKQQHRGPGKGVGGKNECFWGVERVTRRGARVVLGDVSEMKRIFFLIIFLPSLTLELRRGRRKNYFLCARGVEENIITSRGFLPAPLGFSVDLKL